MMEYFTFKVIALSFGYFPFFEIYLAIPAVMGLGLDPVSAVIWSGFGNFLAVPTVIFFYEQLSKVKRIRGWLNKLSNSRYRDSIEKYGGIMVLVLTPIAGVWAVAAIGKVIGMRKRLLFISSALSIAIYGILTAFVVQLGLDWLA